MRTWDPAAESFVYCSCHDLAALFRPEHCWETAEHAQCDPERHHGPADHAHRLDGGDGPVIRHRYTLLGAAGGSCVSLAEVRRHGDARILHDQGLQQGHGSVRRPSTAPGQCYLELHALLGSGHALLANRGLYSRDPATTEFRAASLISDFKEEY